ncbi:MAG: NrfD/PsrC family molybdoenzyme membrane anchor subunit [Thermoanaerobaculia bacterium]
MKERLPDHATEKRLEELREEAARTGTVAGKGHHPAGAPFPVATAASGYYGLPLLKEPTWTWEVPTYFFVGGTAGIAAMLGVASQLTGGDRTLIRHARWIAAGGAALSAPLLISDLGRPERFLNMLRVFKPQSPMSVGSWTLSAFGAVAAAAALAEELRRRTDLPVTMIGNAAALLSAATGLVMATYTGVLIGATAIPVWSKHAHFLPMHFGASSLASSVSALQLLGHEERALQALGIAAAAFESHSAWRLARGNDRASAPLRRGQSGITTAIGAVLSGPLPLALRVAGIGSRRARRMAAASSLIGSLITRLAWIDAGKASARDPEVAL